MRYSENYNMFLPDYGDPSLVDNINDNTETIDELIHDNRTMIAPAFDPAQAYVTGDPVEYQGKLYVFTADKAAGAWDASKVEQTTAAEIGGGGASALEDLDDVEITNPSTGQALLFDDDDDVWKNQNLPDVSVTKEASGNPIEITDAADAPMVKCVTQITGSQDLHGYDKPWVGGAGKNKLPLTVDGIKALNTNGTWTGNTYSYIGLTITLLVTDGNVTGISVTGTKTQSGTYRFALYEDMSMDGASELNGCPSGGGSSTYRLNWVGNGNDDGAGVSVASPSSGNVNLIIYQTTQINKTFYPMIRLASVTDSTFAPYSNICPITAYTEGEIVERGKNLFDKDNADILTGRALNPQTGEVYATSNWSVSNYIKIEPSTTYTLNTMPSGSNSVAFYDSEKAYISGYGSFGTRTTPSNAKYVRFDYRTEYLSIMQLEKGSTATTYEPYTGTTHTTTYPSAIYRGSEDCVKGSLSYDMPVIDLGDLTWTKKVANVETPYFFTTLSDAKYVTGNTNVICTNYSFAQVGSTGSDVGLVLVDTLQLRVRDVQDYVDASAFKSAMSGVMLAYELATPTTSSVTPTNLPIRTLSGYNHIESSTGEMEIEYITKPYEPVIKATDISIEDHGKTIESIITENLEPRMVASRNYSIGELIISGNKAYRATANIASGATLTVGTNVESTTIEEEIGRSGYVYSTAEQVVGTWIDGSTLYAKSYHMSTVTSTYVTVDSTITCINAKIRNCSMGTITVGGAYNDAQYVDGRMSQSQFARVILSTGGLTVGMENPPSDPITDFDFTIQYTKSSS